MFKDYQQRKIAQKLSSRVDRYCFFHTSRFYSMQARGEIAVDDLLNLCVDYCCSNIIIDINVPQKVDYYDLMEYIEFTITRFYYMLTVSSNYEQNKRYWDKVL